LKRPRLNWCALLVALVPFAMALPASADSGRTYSVASGDALETIANRFDTSVATIIALNSLPNANSIAIGQQLTLPDQVSAPAPQTSTHVVAPGETLDDIAGFYGVTVDDLMAANQVSDPRLLQIGQQLTIPADRSATGRSGDRTASAPRYLLVPYRSQFDGSTWGDSNCGPAALGMAMSYYGEWWSSNGIRRDVNAITGDSSVDGGSTWDSLAYAAKKRGFGVQGLYYGDGFRTWSVSDLMDSVRQGNPPILQVRFRDLPGQESSSWWGDHFIVFLGITASGDVVYHDPAFDGDVGAYRTMSQKQLMRAWGNNYAGIQFSAMALTW
jgi:LysM repeat protein